MPTAPLGTRPGDQTVDNGRRPCGDVNEKHQAEQRRWRTHAGDRRQQPWKVGHGTRRAQERRVERCICSKPRTVHPGCRPPADGEWRRATAGGAPTSGLMTSGGSSMSSISRLACRLGQELPHKCGEVGRLLLQEQVAGVRQQFEAHEAGDVAGQRFSLPLPEVRVIPGTDQQGGGDRSVAGQATDRSRPDCSPSRAAP